MALTKHKYSLLSNYTYTKYKYLSVVHLYYSTYVFKYKYLNSTFVLSINTQYSTHVLGHYHRTGQTTLYIIELIIKYLYSLLIIQMKLIYSHNKPRGKPNKIN